MKALLLTESAPPMVGGVEKHISQILPWLVKQGWAVTVLSRREFLPQPSRWRGLGLLQIWWQLLTRHWQTLREAELILIHDVFIYYLPFVWFWPNKKIITTFHGYEKIYPIPRRNIFYKQLAQKFSTATLSIGSYINQYYQLDKHNNFLSYGGVTLPRRKVKLADKQADSFLFVGRLEPDTGLPMFLDFLSLLKQHQHSFSVQFCGAGPLTTQCQKFGPVLGWRSPRPLLRRSSACFVGGYLSALEGMALHNLVLCAYEHPLKKDYWLTSPLAPYLVIGNSAEQLYQEYLRLRKQPALLDQAYQLASKHSWSQLESLYAKILAT